MFKSVSINLTGPICGCDVQKLGWYCFNDGPGHGLTIQCETCKTSLRVPQSGFIAHFKLDTSYPGKPKTKEQMVDEKWDVVPTDGTR